jgi:transcription elongation factor Elf1
MKKETYGTCPRCEREMKTFPALSRRDNKTDICSDCGQAEAMEDYYKERWTDKVYWEVK